MGEEWTFTTLKAHFDALRQADREAVFTALTAAEKAVNAALVASEKAILKAEAAAKDRFDASNEIRGAMIDQQKHFATSGQFDALRERTDKVEAAQLTSASKSAGMSQVAAMLLGGVGLLGTVFGIVMAFGGA